MITGLIKLMALVLWLAIWIMPVWCAHRFQKYALRSRFFTYACKGILFIIGVKVHVIGELATTRPLLVVSNHLSYLDVWVLGSQTPVRFTPKSDMAAWPVIATICRISGCIYVERRADKIKDASNSIEAALAAGDAVSLFPEATTGDGLHLLPFKSSFFSLAEKPIGEQQVLVQPAVVQYTHIRKLPIDSRDWPKVAWYGDMLLLPHLWQLVQLGRIDVTLHMLPAVSMEQFADRKEMAAYCQQQVRDTLEYSAH
jgi:lyso-ornithine lipid O-acyltransferase